MKQFLLLSLLVSCGSWTDLESQKTTFYMCEKNHEIAVRHADDYEDVVVRYNQNQQATLHRFVTTERVGYSNQNLLWLPEGKKGMLIARLENGEEQILLKDCKAQERKP